MSKGKNIRKEGKKQPQKTAKEKRMAKRVKKSSPGLLDNVK
ncbi:hypothetical protein [uncultured Shewanella sp.]|nr:hypothetical protein [uncultured Shewanella sp.]